MPQFFKPHHNSNDSRGSKQRSSIRDLARLLRAESRRKWNAWMRSIARDSRERSLNEEINKYDRPRVKLGVFALIGVLFVCILKSLSSAPLITDIVKDRPSEFFPVQSGFIFSARGEPPFNEKVTQVPLRLPAPDLHILAKENGLDTKNFWYEFKIDVPSERFVENETAVLIPKIWGKSIVYVDGVKTNFGTDLWPIVPLLQPGSTISINVSSSEGSKAGIRAIYPLVVGNSDRLQRIVDMVSSDANTFSKAQMAQLIAAFIFCILFVAVPTKPELLIFVLFFGANIAYGYVWTLIDRNLGLISNNGLDLRIAHVIFSFLRSFLLFLFVLEFFRLSRRSLKLYRNAVLAVSIVVIPLLVFFGARFIGNFDFISFIQVIQEAYFLLCTLSMSCTRIAFMAARRVPVARLVSAGVLVLAISYCFFSNLLDYFSFYQKITHEYMNHLITYFVVGTITMYEFGRTNSEHRILKDIVPKELALSFDEELAAVNEGFIVLVDAVGFTQKQDELPGPHAVAFFQKCLSLYLLKNFFSSETSVLQGTGDGFYFSWRAEPDSSKLRDILVMVNDLISKEVRLSDIGCNYLGDQKIEFRVALTYGRYVVDSVKYQGLLKDYTASTQLSRLARIIGSSNGSPNVRVLMDSDEDYVFLSEDAVAQSLSDKHKKVHWFYDFNSIELKKRLSNGDYPKLVRRTLESKAS